MASNAKKIWKSKVEETKRLSGISFRASSLRKKHRKGELRAKKNKMDKRSKKIKRAPSPTASRPMPSYRQDATKIIFTGEVGWYTIERLRDELNECDFNVPVDVTVEIIEAGLRRVTLKVDGSCAEAFRRELYKSSGNLYSWRHYLEEKTL